MVFVLFLALAFGLYLIILLAKTGIDYDNPCEFLVINTTTIANTTFYGNEYVCHENTTNTAVSFLKVILNFFKIFWIYVFLYVSYLILKFFNVIGGSKP